MITPKMYYAKVIDNDDTNLDDGRKLARISVRILPEMKDVAVKYLTWLKPFVTDGMNVPQVDDYVWVVFTDEYFKEGFYINDKLFLNNFFDWDTINTNISKITEVGTITYPDIKCRQYVDGTIEFHNVSTSAHGVYHSSGAYQLIDPDGNIYSKDKSGNKITMDTSGVLIEDKTKNKVTMNTSGIRVHPFAGKDLVFQTVTSALWNPNILPNCIFSGAPHGGSGAGITDLKGS